LRRKPWFVFAFCCGYALAYHAIYIPGVLLVLSGISQKKGWRLERPELLGLLGLGVGLLLNPYFPQNIIMGWTHLKLALSSRQSLDPETGLELFPLPFAEYLTIYSFHILSVALAAVYFYRTEKTAVDEEPDGQKRFLLWASALFWILTARSPRAQEYAIPLTTCVIALFAKNTWISIANARPLMLLAPLALVPAISEHYFGDPGPALQPIFAFLALDRIPYQPNPGKILNCSWSSSPYIFYRRPELRFVDILEPALLRLIAPNLSDLRLKLRKGKVPDPFKVVKDDFHADYVLCSDPALYDQLDRDSRFRKLFPIAEPFPMDMRAMNQFYLFSLIQN
jgi:hypothetical protein